MCRSSLDSPPSAAASKSSTAKPKNKKAPKKVVQNREFARLAVLEIRSALHVLMWMTETLQIIKELETLLEDYGETDIDGLFHAIYDTPIGRNLKALSTSADSYMTLAEDDLGIRYRRTIGRKFHRIVKTVC